MRLFCYLAVLYLISCDSKMNQNGGEYIMAWQLIRQQPFWNHCMKAKCSKVFKIIFHISGILFEIGTKIASYPSEGMSCGKPHGGGRASTGRT